MPQSTWTVAPGYPGPKVGKWYEPNDPANVVTAQTYEAYSNWHNKASPPGPWASENQYYVAKPFGATGPMKVQMPENLESWPPFGIYKTKTAPHTPRIHKNWNWRSRMNPPEDVI